MITLTVNEIYDLARFAGFPLDGVAPLRLQNAGGMARELAAQDSDSSNDIDG